MISLLKGEVVSKKESNIEIMTSGGIGYSLFASLSAIKDWEVGEEVKALTYLAVRESALELYGFTAEKERKLFLKLLDVSGIGPKSALHILSLGSVSEITSAINNGDITYLTKVSGIGRKTAERIVVELRDKMAVEENAVINHTDGGVVGDVVQALVGLGYSLISARETVHSLNSSGKSTEELLRESLQRIK